MVLQDALAGCIDTGDDRRGTSRLRCARYVCVRCVCVCISEQVVGFQVGDAALQALGRFSPLLCNSMALLLSTLPSRAAQG